MEKYSLFKKCILWSRTTVWNISKLTGGTFQLLCFKNFYYSFLLYSTFAMAKALLCMKYRLCYWWVVLSSVFWFPDIAHSKQFEQHIFVISCLKVGMIFWKHQHGVIYCRYAWCFHKRSSYFAQKFIGFQLLVLWHVKLCESKVVVSSLKKAWNCA